MRPAVAMINRGTNQCLTAGLNVRTLVWTELLYIASTMFRHMQAPQAGEAVEFLIEEGKPVEFREEVVSLAPFFGGHIIGDAKYS